MGIRNPVCLFVCRQDKFLQRLIMNIEIQFRQKIMTATGLVFYGGYNVIVLLTPWMNKFVLNSLRMKMVLYSNTISIILLNDKV